jgi:hypothetical protein
MTVTHLSNNKFFLQMFKQNLQDENESLTKSACFNQERSKKNQGALFIFVSRLFCD